MKKFLTSFIACMIFTILIGVHTNQAHAQTLRSFTPTTAKDSLVDAENLLINIVIGGNDVTGIHCTGTRASGTLAGTVILQGSLDGTNWANVDTFTLSNAAYMIATFPIQYKLPYVRYRLSVTTSGTVKVTGIRGHTVRRAG